MTTLCRTCHQPIPDKPALPAAKYLSIHTAGRQVFAIEGKPGLWIKRGTMNGGMEQDESIEATIKAGKGRTGVRLYRQKKLENELRRWVVDDAARYGTGVKPADKAAESERSKS